VRREEGSPLTDFSESEEDPEQEEAALDVRSSGKERKKRNWMPQSSSPRISLKKPTHHTSFSLIKPDTNKRKKKRAMMMILSEFSTRLMRS